MLGTLAIAGILSIVGVWAYHVAMDRHHANTLIEEGYRRAVEAAGQINLMDRKNPSLGIFTNNTFGGGTFATQVVTDGLYEQFGIKVSGVSKSVCENVKGMIGQGTPLRRLSLEGDAIGTLSDCVENNTFLMVYNNNLSTGGGDTTYTDDCGCQTVCGVCVMEGEEKKCVNECPVNPGQCTKNSDC